MLALMVVFFRSEISLLKFAPDCMLFQYFGLHCPGCGMTRACHALAQGDWLQAFFFNMLGISLLILLALILVWEWYHWLRFGQLMNLKWRLSWTTSLLVLICVFSVLRNISCFPFSYLAPTRLPIKTE